METKDWSVTFLEHTENGVEFKSSIKEAAKEKDMVITNPDWRDDGFSFTVNQNNKKYDFDVSVAFGKWKYVFSIDKEMLETGYFKDDQPKVTKEKNLLSYSGMLDQVQDILAA